MGINAQVFSCLREARAVLVDIEVFSTPAPVRVTNGLADENKKRRFVQIGRGVLLAVPPPNRVAIVGMGGKQVMVLPTKEVIPLSF